MGRQNYSSKLGRFYGNPASQIPIDRRNNVQLSEKEGIRKNTKQLDQIKAAGYKNQEVLSILDQAFDQGLKFIRLYADADGNIVGMMNNGNYALLTAKGFQQLDASDFNRMISFNPAIHKSSAGKQREMGGFYGKFKDIL